MRSHAIAPSCSTRVRFSIYECAIISRSRSRSVFTRKSEITNQIDVILDLLGINSNELIIYTLTYHPELNALIIVIDTIIPK